MSLLSSLAGKVAPNLLTFPTFPLNLSIDFGAQAFSFQQPYAAISAVKNTFMTKDRWLPALVDPLAIGIDTGRLAGLVGGAGGLGGLTGITSQFSNSFGSLANPLSALNISSLTSITNLGNLSTLSSSLTASLTSSFDIAGLSGSLQASVQGALGAASLPSFSSLSSTLSGGTFGGLGGALAGGINIGNIGGLGSFGNMAALGASGVNIQSMMSGGLKALRVDGAFNTQLASVAGAFQKVTAAEVSIAAITKTAIAREIPNISNMIGGALSSSSFVSQVTGAINSISTLNDAVSNLSGLSPLQKIGSAAGAAAALVSIRRPEVQCGKMINTISNGGGSPQIFGGLNKGIDRAAASQTRVTLIATPKAISFPPFTFVRSDYLDITEGTTLNPLKIASSPCAYTPAESWQAWLCNDGISVPTTYSASNGFRMTPDLYHTWIISCNNEFIQDAGCNTGPPNQSLGPNEYPFSLSTSASSISLRVTHDARPYCSKLPYMSATYIRGVQAGDTKTRLASWDEIVNKKLKVSVDINRFSNTSVWFRILTHFRDFTGKRYFVNKDYVMPDTIPNYIANWNWPYESSFQFPGAVIAIPARDPLNSLPSGSHFIEMDIATLAEAHFSSFPSIKPDFLGVEIAIELGPVTNWISADIKSVSIT